MKEEWLMSGAVVPVDVETTAALVAEIHKLINVVGGMVLAQPAQGPVAWAVYDKRGGSKSLHWPENHSHNGDATMFDAVPLVPQRQWVGLTEEEASWCQAPSTIQTWKRIEAALKEKNFD